VHFTLHRSEVGAVSRVRKHTLGPMTSKQLSELFNCEPRIPDDSCHRDRVHRVMARDRYEVNAIRHDDVLALKDNLETCLSKRLDGILMVDTGQLGHGQTETSISRTSACCNESATASKYSRIAS